MAPWDSIPLVVLHEATIKCQTQSREETVLSLLTLLTEARDKRQGFPQIVLLRDVTWNWESLTWNPASPWTKPWMV